MMKINNFRGDLIDISAKKEPLPVRKFVAGVGEHLQPAGLDIATAS